MIDNPLKEEYSNSGKSVGEATIRIRMTTAKQWRHYSLVNSSGREGQD